ncbi:thiol:disulfide interchange protein DsbG [Rhodanobacter sp. UC4450_H17]|jgi:thiol:disulfide interchange protein DsbG
MKKMTRNLLALPFGALLIGTYALFTWPRISEAADTTQPAPVTALSAQGLEIVEKFDAPSGLTGYAATVQGRPIAIYVTSDRKHAIVGTLVDAAGKDMTSGPLERIVAGPQGEKAWKQMESAAWVLDGSKDAKTIVYEFTDPNCPYCHKFWEVARPWVDAGKVQIRHVMVGILKSDSAPKAATILAAKDPAAAFARAEREYGQGGIKVADNIPDSAHKKVAANNELMQSLGYFATPTILYKKANGEIGVKQGLPQGKDIDAILGSKPTH